MRRIAFATYAGASELTADDRLLVAPLAALGFEVRPLAWEAPLSILNSGTTGGPLDGVAVRSCWNYHEKPAPFLAWGAELERRGTPLCNSARLIRWNLDKHYLGELAAAGIPIPETRFIGPSDRP